MNSKPSTHQKQNLQPLDLAESSSSNPTKIHDEQSRQIAILFEYVIVKCCRCMDHCSESTQSPISTTTKVSLPILISVVWNCIIFIRKGFYKDGKFKFDLSFTHEFPHKPPTLTFKSPLFHPLVREDGLVDTDEMLGEEWNYQNQNMVYSLFSGLERMFHDKGVLEVRHSYNGEAAKMLAMKPHTFIERAFHSVEMSKDNLYKNQQGTSLVIKKYENGELEPYKQKLQTLCAQNRAPEEKRREFYNFVMSEVNDQ